MRTYGLIRTSRFAEPQQANTVHVDKCAEVPGENTDVLVQEKVA